MDKLTFWADFTKATMDLTVGVGPLFVAMQTQARMRGVSTTGRSYSADDELAAAQYYKLGEAISNMADKAYEAEGNPDLMISLSEGIAAVLMITDSLGQSLLPLVAVELAARYTIFTNGEAMEHTEGSPDALAYAEAVEEYANSISEVIQAGLHDNAPELQLEALQQGLLGPLEEDLEDDGAEG